MKSKIEIAVKYLCVLFFAMFCLNCTPLIIGGAITSSTNKNAQQVFLSEFYKNNLEREKAGLCPLDLCIAKYQFDKYWALEDSECRKIISAFKRGEIDQYGRKINK